MNIYSSLLKKIRIKKGYTQERVSQGIMSRSLYSRLENGSVDVSFETLNKLLLRLGYSLADYVKDIQNADDFNRYYKIYYKAFNREATTSEVQDLVLYLETLKTHSNQHLCLYGTTKYILHSRYPAIVPEITEDDTRLFHNHIMDITAPYSYYDLKLIADFAPLVLSSVELDILYASLLPINPYEYLESKTDYTILIFKILNNYFDVAIERNELAKAQAILEQYKAYCDIFKDIRFNYYYKIAHDTLAYLTSYDETYLDNLTTYAKVFSNVEDDETATLILNQAEAIRNHSYKSSEHITRDK